MKSFDSRAYSINDFLEWSKGGQLSLSPKFQRRSVWSDNARSYLMDTIIRGKPIPKVFIRQTVNASTKKSVREVVDGQQRLRTILGFLADGFQISKKHNKEYGGLYFSQLSTVDDDVQSVLLNYEISVDLLINMSDSEILDVFGRLNSYAVVLNAQEKINADHFGPFKVLADNIGHRYNDFWIKNGVLTSAQIMRMADVTLVADLLVAALEGIKGKKQIGVYYDSYEKVFDASVEELDQQFSEVLGDITRIFGASIAGTQLARAPIFYTLFTVLYHLRYGIRGLLEIDRRKNYWNYARLRSVFENVEKVLLTEDKKLLGEAEQQFLVDARLATTDAVVRVRRANFVLQEIVKVF